MSFFGAPDVITGGVVHTAVILYQLLYLVYGTQMPSPCTYEKQIVNFTCGFGDIVHSWPTSTGVIHCGGYTATRLMQ